jgi:transcriptional antiterminator NusG
MGLLRFDFGLEKIMNDLPIDASADSAHAVELTQTITSSVVNAQTGEDGAVFSLAPSSNPDFKWYVVHAYSGMEKAVERNIIERIQRSGMQSKFGRILVPTEEVVEMKNGQKKTTERRFFPGYVLVEMVMDDESWHLVKHTNKVTGFVGGAKNRPAPISQDEVQKIVSQMQEGSDKPRHKVEFMVGELVRVKEGPFTDFNGSIEEVNYEKNKVRVSVTIFGRATPVELEFGQIEKT